MVCDGRASYHQSQKHLKSLLVHAFHGKARIPDGGFSEKGTLGAKAQTLI